MDGEGDFVLYWMIAARRTRFNFALQRAVELANELRRPLLVLEALRVGYPWASARLHRFVIEGMLDNARRCTDAGVRYLAYVEPRAGAGRGLVEALSARACAVVTDEFPCFFLPRMVAAVAPRLPVTLEQVDGNGVIPLRAGDRDFKTAASFRRFLQKNVAEQLRQTPCEEPLADLPAGGHWAPVDEAVLTKWPMLDTDSTEVANLVRGLPIDQSVGPASISGGSVAAEQTLTRFLDERLADYGEGRNHPDGDAQSGLSPFLHFGHVSVHAVLAEIFEREEWTVEQLPDRATGSREGWWGMSGPSEAFLDEILTWREIGYQFTHRHADDYDRFESLPAWARDTIETHAGDPRPQLYSQEELRAAETHDEIWNAAQRELVREGRMHNYLRMLWAKKIYEWSPHVHAAIDTLIELNNRYALDGRNPNSYSGIFWTLGRFDRAWGPERPIFGKLRYMSSKNTARKVRLKGYLERYGA